MNGLNRNERICGAVSLNINICLVLYTETSKHCQRMVRNFLIFTLI